MKKLILLFTVLTLPLIATSQIICLGKTPVEAAKNFYKKHANFYYENPKKQQNILSSTFATILQRDYDCATKEGICAQEADPWIGAQDGNINQPQFSLQANNALQATVAMKYVFKIMPKQKGKPQSVTLKLTRHDTKSCWLIDDFIDPKGESLSQLIRTELDKFK